MSGIFIHIVNFGLYILIAMLLFFIIKKNIVRNKGAVKASIRSKDLMIFTASLCTSFSVLRSFFSETSSHRMAETGAFREKTLFTPQKVRLFFMVFVVWDKPAPAVVDMVTATLLNIFGFGLWLIHM